MKMTLRRTMVWSASVVLAAALQAGDDACKATAAGTCPASQAAAAGTCPASQTAAVKAGLQKVSYQVGGMSCGACEEKIAKALNAIEGVRDASACSDQKLAKLAYDPKRVKEAQLVAAIEKAGFKVESEQIELKVSGLACGDCSGKVSKALVALDGVKQQEVCHEAKHAVVTFDPKKLSREKIVAAIDKTGFAVVQ